MRTSRAARSREQGFTLLELMIVMVVIGLLAAIAIPSYTHNVLRANEAVLREDLYTMRGAIDSYTVDKQKGPQTLDDLVQAGYLKFMPKDPYHQTERHLGSRSGRCPYHDRPDRSRHHRRPLRSPADLL